MKYIMMLITVGLLIGCTRHPVIAPKPRIIYVKPSVPADDIEKKFKKHNYINMGYY